MNSLPLKMQVQDFKLLEFERFKILFPRIRGNIAIGVLTILTIYQ
jgi:hypothetical protein